MPLEAGSFGGVPVNETQARHANLIIGIGNNRSINKRDIIIALMVAMQESKLGVAGMIKATDHDSLGLFQQRPSQGWGTPDQVMDPAYATNKFYDTLLTITNRNNMSTSAAAQAVQRSAFPGAYAQWENMATDMVNDRSVIGMAFDVLLGLGADKVTGAVDAITPEWVKSLSKLVAFVTDTRNWYRVGLFFGGSLLIIIAAVILGAEQLVGGLLSQVVKRVRKGKVK